MTTEHARQLRKRMTHQEVKLWLWLRSLRPEGHHFRRQSPLGPYIVDFECRRAKLVVEVDGGQHGLDYERIKDARRDAFLWAAGYEVLRVWNPDVDRNLAGVAEAILDALKRRQAPPGRQRRPPSPGR